MKDYPSFLELRLLQELVKERSLTAAAVKLSLTVPTASHYLAHLRQIFGDKLFIKAKEGLVPTSRVQELAGKTLEAICALESLVTEEEFDLAHANRTIRIGCVDNAPYSLFPTLIKYILDHAPGLRLEFQELRGTQLEEVRRGELDFFISPLSGVLPPGFKSLELGKNEYCLLARSGHPLAQSGKAASDAEVCLYPFIDIRVGQNLPRSSTLRETVFPRWKKAKSQIVSPYFLPFISSLETSDCLTVSSRKSAEKFLNRYDIVEIKTKTAPKVNIPRLIWHEATDRDPLLQWFRSSLLLVARTGAVA